MIVKIIRIGNSKGIRIPKHVLEETGFEEEVELTVRSGELVITPASKPRSGWDDAARELAERGEDRLLDGPVATDFDDEEWVW